MPWNREFKRREVGIRISHLKTSRMLESTPDTSSFLGFLLAPRLRASIRAWVSLLVKAARVIWCNLKVASRAFVFLQFQGPPRPPEKFGPAPALVMSEGTR